MISVGSSQQMERGTKVFSSKTKELRKETKGFVVKFPLRIFGSFKIDEFPMATEGFLKEK